MIFAGFDTETTGLEPGDHRFVELFVGVYDLAGGRFKSLLWRVNPERSIPAESQKIHGITLSELIREPTWDIVGPRVHTALTEVDFIVAHNGIGFDMPFVNHEFKRIGLPPINKPVVDTMLDGRWAHPYGKVPNLAELCWACGVDYDTSKAHAADYDVDVMVECFIRGLEWGFFSIPKIEEELAA